MEPTTLTGSRFETFPAPPRIVDHELLRCIGSGAYGEVWLARNVMGTYRAVKVIYRARFSEERSYNREYHGIEKFEPVSRTHDGLVDILQVGRNDDEGYYYYVMELADDRTLGQKIDPATYQAKTLGMERVERSRLSYEDCLRVGLSLAVSLGHLHKHGLIHRDIKPANIIFVNGIAKIADIGLVTEVGITHSIVGTEGFMPPEGPGSVQADIYSLGKVLYEISTGHDRKDFPVVPTKLDETTALHEFMELNEVILRACEVDVHKRYRTAEQIHDDLVVLQAGKSLKYLRRLERRIALLKKAGLIAAAFGAMVAAAGWEVSRQWKAQAERVQQQVGRNVAYATRLIDEGDYSGALPPLVNALSVDNDNAWRTNTRRMQIAAIFDQCPKLVVKRPLGDQINGAELSHDGRYLATAGFAGTVTLCDLETGISPLFIKWTNQVHGVAFSPDDRYLSISGVDGVGIWDMSKKTYVQILPLPGHRVYSAHFHSNDKQIVIATKREGPDEIQGYIYLSDWRDGTLDEFTRIAKSAYGSASFSPDGSRILTALRDQDPPKEQVSQLWDVESRRPIGEAIRHLNWIHDAVFSADGRKIATASYDNSTWVCDAQTGRPILPPLRHPSAVYTAGFSQDGRYLVTAAGDFSARIWSLADGALVSPVLRHSGKHIRYAAFTPDSRRVVMIDGTGILLVWDLAGSAPPPGVSNLAFTGKGNRYSALENGQLSLREANDDSLVCQIPTTVPLLSAALNTNGTRVLTVVRGPSSPVAQLWEAKGPTSFPPFALDPSTWGIVLSDDGLRLATRSGTNAQIWDTTAGKLLFSLGHADLIKGISFSPDRQWILTVSGKQGDPVPSWDTNQWDRYVVMGTNLTVWNAADGKKFKIFRHDANLRSAQFSPDSRRIVSCMWDESETECAAVVWDIVKGTKIGRPLKHADGVLDAVFSPDGKKVLTASEDSTARVRDALTGEPLLPPLKHRHEVSGACFSPDGRWIATACRDWTARVWDAETGEPLTPPLKHPWEFRYVQFVNDGHALLTRRSDGKTMLWKLRIDHHSIEQLTQLAQALSGQRDYTGDTLRAQAEILLDPWEMLKAKNISDLAVSSKEIITWHERAAEESERSGQWSAAEFHWNQLTKIMPGDTHFKERSDFARSKSQAGTTGQ